MRLGLTPNQSRLYLWLLGTGKASGGMLSKQTKLARQEIYRLLTDLQEKGLVEKIIASPTEFQAVPIRDGTEILLRQKIMKLKEVEEEMGCLAKEYSSKSQSVIYDKEYSFRLIPANMMTIERSEEMLERAERNINIITNSKRFRQGIEISSERYKKTLKKNTQIRIIVQGIDNLESISKSFEMLSKYSNCELKINPCPKTNLLIIDNKQAVVTLYPEMEGESPVLWTNHPGFLEIYQDYFNCAWSNAKTASKQNNVFKRKVGHEIFSS